jgi:hypothetical protein
MQTSRSAILVACAMVSCSTADPLHLQSFRLASEVQTSTPVASVAPATQPNSGRGAPWSWFNALRGDAYALDDVVRRLEPKARVKCDPALLTSYKGKNIAYAGSVLVDPAFVERLARFEGIVNEVALEVYGRVPSKLLHAGAFSCRTSRTRDSRLSEHALGNALDVVGFSFNRATKAQKDTTPKLAMGYFKVTVGQHWNAERSEASRLHRHFLRTLAERVVVADVFRVALGPSHPGHGDHLHFDMSPWNYTHL